LLLLLPVFKDSLVAFYLLTLKKSPVLDGGDFDVLLHEQQMLMLQRLCI